MELSTGSAVPGDSWQLSSTDLPYASIAPPARFVGSANLVVELRLMPKSPIVRCYIWNGYDRPRFPSFNMNRSRAHDRKRLSPCRRSRRPLFKILTIGT
jgi:hypothetical protein